MNYLFLNILNKKVSDVKARECDTSLLDAILHKPSMNASDTPNNHKPGSSNNPPGDKASLIVFSKIEDVPEVPPSSKATAGSESGQETLNGVEYLSEGEDMIGIGLILVSFVAENEQRVMKKDYYKIQNHAKQYSSYTGIQVGPSPPTF